MEPRRHPIHDATMTLRLIELVKKYPSVWQIADQCNHPLVRKKRAWEEISSQIGIPKPIIVKKWGNLTRSFHRISKEIKECKKTGLGNAETIRKRWFVYEHMAFLEGAKRKKRPAVNETPEFQNISIEHLEVKQEIVEPEIDIFEPRPEASSLPESFHQPTHNSAPRGNNQSFNPSLYQTPQSEEKRSQPEAHFPLTHSLERLANEVQNLAYRKRSPCAGFAETIAHELEQFDRANRLRIMGRISNLLQEEVERTNGFPRSSQSLKFADETEENRET